MIIIYILIAREVLLDLKSIWTKIYLFYSLKTTKMATINPYLNFNGTTEEAFNFYKGVFGGEFTGVHRFRDIPWEEVPVQYADKIMHIGLPIWKWNILMGTDAIEWFWHKLVAGTNISLSLNVDSKEEADKLYQGLSVGGEIEMPIGDTFWWAYYASFTDKFGIQWMINYEYPRQ